MKGLNRFKGLAGKALKGTSGVKAAVEISGTASPHVVDAQSLIDQQNCFSTIEFWKNNSREPKNGRRIISS
jgi:hypothetical protein